LFGVGIPELLVLAVVVVVVVLLVVRFARRA
jgi:hypothetical protein